MKPSRTLLCAAAALLLASAASAEPAPVQLNIQSPQNQPILMSQDPLTRQIIQQVTTQENGGVTAVVRAESGQGVEVRLPAESAPAEPAAVPAKPGAIPTLTPLPALVKETKAPAPKRKQVKKASTQLKVLDKQGKKPDWESGGGRQGSKPKKDESTEVDIY